MATARSKGSGLLVLGSDLVVDESVFLGNAQNSVPEKSLNGTERVSHEEFSDLDELQFLRLEGVDRQRRRIVRIVGKYYPVDRGDNSPGMLNLRRIYEDLPEKLRKQLEAIYVVHPGLRSRLLLATVGRFFLSEGFYSKVQYVNRVEFLVDYVKKGQVVVPEFVQEHDDELESRPLMDYGFEADPNGYADGPGLGATSKFGVQSVF